MNFLGQRVAQAHRDAAFHLDLSAGGIDHEAHLLHPEHTFHGNFSRRDLHSHLRNGRHIAAGISTAGDTDAPTAGAFRRFPAPLFGRGLQHPGEPVILKLPEAKLNRVNPGQRGELVDMALAGEGVVA